MKLVWQFVEGRLLLLQVAAMLSFAAFGVWIWYRTIYLYVPAAHEPPRCLTGVGAAFVFILLAEAYSFVFALWQVVLLRRRWEGIVGWVGTTWLVLLLSFVPVWLAIDAWLGVSAAV